MDEEAAIPVLSSDCLYAIFRNLKVLERVKLRKVCKSWRDVADDCWREVTSLEISHRPYSKKTTIHDNGVGLCVFTSSTAVAAALMQLCARHLKNFSYRAEFCDSLLYLLKDSRNIENVTIEITSRAQDAQFGEILEVNRLKNLQIRMFYDHTCLRHLCTDQLEELQVTISGNCESSQADDEVYEEFGAILSSKIDSSEKLKTLWLSDISAKSFPLIKKSGIEELTIVDLSHSNRQHITDVEVKNIAQLSNLRRLTVTVTLESTIVDDLLVNLSGNCRKLEAVTLEPCNQVTDRGLKSLSLLGRLKYLSVSHTPRLTSDCLSRFTSIEKLEIRDTEITNEGVVEIVRNCWSLNNVLFTGNHLKVSILRDLVADIVDERDGCVPLNLSVNCEHVWPNSGKSPILALLMYLSNR